MKRILRFTTWLFAGVLFMLVAVSCTEKDDWTPGPQPEANNPGVYFDRSMPAIAELDVDDSHNLIHDFFVITLGRDKLKTGQALTVPIKINYAAPNLSVPESVTFEAGEEKAELIIKIGDFQIATPYNLSLEIDQKFCNPYLSYSGSSEGGASRIDMKVQMVAALGTVTFTPGDYSGGTPKFKPFQQKIYINADGSYTIKNFLFNNAGYDFTFSLDEDNNILPLPDSGYFEEGTGSAARWYFYSAPADASANRIPCYIPGDDPAEYITYIYFYLDPTYRYFGFYLDKATKTGKMWGYSRFSAGLSSGRMSFTLKWD